VKTELKFPMASDVLASQGRHRSENLSFPAIGNSGFGRSLSPAALRIDEVFAAGLAELIPLSAVPQSEMNVFLVPGEDSANEHVPPQRILTSHNNDRCVCGLTLRGHTSIIN
jgi:hypothetical protein